jgi:hypothetical protein
VPTTLPVMDENDCIRCGETRQLDDNGYCQSQCHWKVQSEVVYGLSDLYLYLRGWSRFSDWCDERGLSAC